MTNFVTAALVLCSVASVASSPIQHEEFAIAFERYTIEFNKTYTAEEVDARMAAVQANMLKINDLNEIEGEEVYGLTKFSDLTAAEFKAQYLSGFKPSADIDRANVTVTEPELTHPAVNASSVDWRSKGVVTPVKDQASCGSCWAFSATEEIETAWLMAGNSKQILSPQQIVSCDTKDEGCNGGDTPTAYNYVKKAGGIVSEKSYPYSSGKGRTGTCKKKDLSDKVVKIKGFTYATPPALAETSKKPNEDKMAQNIATKGPASVCVDAESWQNYKKGVVTKTCKKQLDHCVQAVGYNKAGAKPYWIVRNSWNTDWGVDGYIYVGMGGDYCGIADEATLVEV